jgi:GNAT superfamily N-acetyltransferase
MSFQYRLAKREDAEAIVDFQLAMALETENLKLDRDTCLRGVLGVFDVPARGTYYVAETGKEVAASTLVIPEWSDWRNGEVWWIHSVYVSPEYRERGVFSGIYRFIQSEVKSRPDLRGLRLYVEKKNLDAQAVYRRLGMTDEHYHLFEWMKTF